MNLYQRIKNAGAVFLGREIPRTGIGGGYSSYDLGALIGQSGSSVDWAREARPYYNNPIVAICAAKLASMIGEAELHLQEWDAKAKTWKASEGAAATKLERMIAKPNEFETWSQIERAMTLSYSVFGEVFLFIRRNELDVPVGFTWLSPFEVKPMADKYNEGGAKTITYFEHQLPGADVPKELRYEDVMFIRKGINPQDPKRGFSEVLQAVREITLYNDAATRHGAMVRNPGSGNLIYPDPQKDGIAPTPEQVGKGRDLINTLVMDRAGKSAMVPFRVGVEKLGWKPEELDLSGIRQSAIDIICPAFGGDAMAFGLPSSSKTYDNLAESLDALGKQTVLPMLADWSDALSRLLIPALRLDTSMYRVWYDTSAVSWLQDETASEQERYRENFKVGGMSLASFKTKIGEKPDKGDDQRNYFTLQAEGNGLAVPVPQSNSVSEWARSLVSRDAQTRRATGRVQLNAVQASKPNTKQSAHDKRIAKAKQTLLDLTEKNQAGQLDSDAYQRAFSDELRSLHSEMYRIGRELAGKAATDEEAEQIGLQVADLEQTFLAGLVADLQDGKYEGVTPALDQRLGMYASKGSSSASLGFVDGSEAEEEFYWDMNGAVEAHCQDCPYLEANSPYMKDTLYTAPRRGDTPCLSNCKCRLVRSSDGQTGFGPI